jgi:hypothetical protein
VYDAHDRERDLIEIHLIRRERRASDGHAVLLRLLS